MNTEDLREELKDEFIGLYQDEFDFDFHFDEVVSKLNAIDKTIELNRVIFLKNMKDIDIRNLGNHWVEDESLLDEDFQRYLKEECPPSTLEGNASIISCSFSSSAIDREITIRKFIENPYEEEIFIKSNAQPVSDIKITDIDSNEEIIVKKSIYSDLAKVSKSANMLNNKYWNELNITPWEINNGLCDQYAQELTSCIKSNNGNAYEIEFFNITNTADYDWDDFYENSVENLNLLPTHNLTKDELIKEMSNNADNTHVWTVFEINGLCFHFDAECPEGVNNPFKLPTYDKFLSVKSKELSTDDLKEHLRKHKVESIFQFKTRMKMEKNLENTLEPNM